MGEGNAIGEEGGRVTPGRSAPRRPPLFRALGRSDPPPRVEAGGAVYVLERVLKHDSWAATSVYASAAGERIACKLNRAAPILGVPMGWAGRRLAAREERAMALMEEVEGFPRRVGPITVEGRRAPNGVAHRWIEGRTFAPSLKVDDDFFPRLREMVEALHRRNVAFVDLSKWENILVGDDGRPHLIDFQIHYRHSGRVLPRRFLVWLQESDRHHLLRHWSRSRPDQLTDADRALALYRPWILKLADALGPPLRALRRALLRLGGAGA